MALSDINLVTFCVNAFHVHTETYRESPDPSPCVILKAIGAGVGWVWLARLAWLVHQGVTLTVEPKVKFLGVIVVKDLNWSEHVTSIRRKCLAGMAQ